jgi:hypothetical protein
MMLHPMSNPLLFIFQDYLFSSHVSGKCFNGCALERRWLFGVWNVGLCGYGWGVHTFTKISQHVNMENNVAPMCVNVVAHGVEMVLMWQDGDVAMDDKALI